MLGQKNELRSSRCDRVSDGGSDARGASLQFIVSKTASHLIDMVSYSHHDHFRVHVALGGVGSSSAIALDEIQREQPGYRFED